MILESVGIDSASISPKLYATRIEEYQNSNCGARRVIVGRVSSELLTADEIKVILDSNKVSYLETSDKTVLDETYRAAITDSALTEKDLTLLKKDTLINILKEKSISTSSADNKSVLIGKILGK